MKRTSVLLLLTACGTAATNVVPMGNDTFMVSSRGDTGFAPLSSIRAEAIGLAAQHCGNQGKRYQPIHTREVATGFGVWPEVEIQFRCEEVNK